VIASLSCKEDLEKMFNEGKSDEILLEDIVDAIDKFYMKADNLVIPIMFAYCYTIKKFAGTSKKELNDYRDRVLKFCESESKDPALFE
jgi:hypothetical protein